VKRTSWISWRIYFFTLPIDVVVLVLAADHRIKNFNDILIWSLTAIISHLALIPLVTVGVTQSQQWRNWKFDLAFLILMGATRGAVINLCVESFDLTQTVSDAYKVFNSTVALPQWFVGVAIFIESRREYQLTFRELFAQAMHKEQETHERSNLLPNSTSNADETIARLQFVTTNLANDIKNLLNRPDALKDYSAQAEKIQRLIDEGIRPASAELWRESGVHTPKISFMTLASMALLESRLRVFLVIFISVPYLFVGLNGTFGFKIAIFHCLLISAFDLSIFAISEILYKLRLLGRSQANIFLMVTCFFLPFFIQFDFFPKELAISTDPTVIFFGQLLLSMAFIALLMVVNGYSVVNKQRHEVIASLEKHISGDRYSASISKGGEAQRNTDLANYLHGEVQAGLTASSLLLQQAAKSGDSDLAHEALERASGLLNQDLTNISYTRMATPEVKINKIVDAWKGIADISLALPPFEQLNDEVLRSSVQLIEEAVANSIRHAKATDIKISGVLNKELLTITVISNGDPMTKGKAGLGTKMFNDLSAEWNYAAESGHNRLTFTLVNQK
jgi:signal transduction histidine kinase